MCGTALGTSSVAFNHHHTTWTSRSLGGICATATPCVHLHIPPAPSAGVHQAFPPTQLSRVGLGPAFLQLFPHHLPLSTTWQAQQFPASPPLFLFPAPKHFYLFSPPLPRRTSTTFLLRQAVHTNTSNLQPHRKHPDFSNNQSPVCTPWPYPTALLSSCFGGTSCARAGTLGLQC